jgi:EAL and modified HD-GYP domain-containing signal transduction protein
MFTTRPGQVQGMSDVFVARQPIFDRTLKVAGYELLFRDGPVDRAVITNAQGATAAVVLNAFTEIGLQHIVGTKTAWLNVSREFVLGGFAGSLPPGLVLLELLEGQPIDDPLIAAVTDLKQQGHRIALGDFQHTPAAEPLLGLADVVKLDLVALGRAGLAREVSLCRRHSVTVLAEKLETQEDYKYCAELGCDLFQGYFFCRPQLVRGPRLDANRLSLLALLAALQDPAAQLADLEGMIARDLRVSYRLLGYINSAFFALRQPVRSIGQALALLGIENLKRWAALSVFASIDAKPAELTATALIRARFCELAGQSEPATARGELFTLGLFSVIDALMDTPITELLTKLPFPPDMRDALTEHRGPKGRLLGCVTAIEAGDLDRAHAIVPSAAQVYLAALTWANQASDAVFAPASAA